MSLEEQHTAEQERPKTLKELFNDEHELIRMARLEGRELPAPAKSVTDPAYKKEVSVLPKKAFADVDFNALLPKNYKHYWPHGTTCCAAAFAFNDGGFGKDEMQIEGKWEKFLEQKSFLRLLMVMPLSRLTSGFGNAGDPAGRYFDLLPDILKKDVSEGGCSFTVEYKDLSDSKNTDDRQWFTAQCARALSNLQKFLEE
jgi:hypothetical protein